MIYNAAKYGLFRKDLSGREDAEPADESELRVEVVRDVTAFEKLVGQSNISWCPFASKMSYGVKKGAVLFLIVSGSDVAHVSWVSPEKEASVVDPVCRKLDIEDAVYIGPCLTHPSHRGKGYYPFVLRRICGHNFGNGKTKAYICTKVSNTASVSGIEKAGFRKVGEFSYRRFMRWGFYDIPSVGVGV